MSSESSFGRISNGQGKVSLMSLDTKEILYAQYNPKELQVDREVPWNQAGDSNTSTPPQNTAKTQTGIDLEFTGAKGRTVTLELLFDAVESGAEGGVSAQIAKLEEWASLKNPEEKDEEKRRPHWCVVSWGKTLKFSCVINSLSTKYTMFDAEGTPLRATCTVKLMEADSVSGKKKAPAGAAGGGGGGAATGSSGGGR